MSADPSSTSGSLEIRLAPAGLLDEPLRPRSRGAGPDEALGWSARLRDDEGRVWKALARPGEDLGATWIPAKASTDGVAALQSLRPVSIDVRAEAADGRTAVRTVTRSLVGDGVRLRRWRDGLTAVLHRPADATPCATVLIDATAGADEAAVAALAGPLLASRGALVLVVGPTRGRAASSDVLDTAAERLTAVPGAAADPVRPTSVAASARSVGPASVAASAGSAGPESVWLPPGVAIREEEAAATAAERAAAWDALLARLHARPRLSAGDPPSP